MNARTGKRYFLHNAIFKIIPCFCKVSNPHNCRQEFDNLMFDNLMSVCAQRSWLNDTYILRGSLHQFRSKFCIHHINFLSVVYALLIYFVSSQQLYDAVNFYSHFIDGECLVAVGDLYKTNLQICNLSTEPPVYKMLTCLLPCYTPYRHAHVNRWSSFF